MDTKGIYEAPTVEDLGDLPTLTQAMGLFGTEDGASKLVPIHHNPSAPSP